MGNKISGINFHKAGLTALIWILAFQSPLEKVWDPFSYIDEFTALIGACLGLYDIVVIRKGRPSKEQLWMGIPLMVFITVGLTGNVIYQYQPLKCVIIDLYTNLKFFFAIGTGYYLFTSMDWEELKKTAGWNARFIVACLFMLFVLDRIFHIWPGQIRYGMSSAVLFYSHPTYLAGAMAFLLVVLIFFYDRKNIMFLVMSAVMMAFTFRSKAIASSVVCAGMVAFFILMNKRVKLWHVLVVAVGCVAIAWPQISYYFIELGGYSTRSVMHEVALNIARDYFPIGTGFGTYASAEASKNFSPVYEIYNFEYLLRFEVNRQWLYFMNDTFWPIIIGQTGAIGTVAYVTAHGALFVKNWCRQNVNVYAFAAVLYGLGHLFISSVGEPAFNNATSVPIAVIIGITLCEKNVFAEKDGQLSQKRVLTAL